MEAEAALESLSRIEGLTLRRDVDLGRYTTWRVGGPAKVMAWSDSESSAAELLSVARETGLEIFVIGNGSNILVSDGGTSKLVLRLSGDLAKVEVDGAKVDSGAGALLSSVVAEAYRNGLSGLEFSFGIPGTVGGAVMMNAGAFSGSVSEVLLEVDTLTPDGRNRSYSEFADTYREPLVPGEDLVLRASFALEPDSQERVRVRMDEVRSRRREEQPWGMATAGSVFKNPEGVGAGELIDRCGLKGRAIGRARVSEKHANFIINEGGATAGDIKSLIEDVAAEVESRTGIVLETEVELLGFDEE